MNELIEDWSMSMSASISEASRYDFCNRFDSSMRRWSGAFSSWTGASNGGETDEEVEGGGGLNQRE